MDYKLSYTNSNGREMTLRHDFTNDISYVFHESMHTREQNLVDSLKKNVYASDEMTVLQNFIQTIKGLGVNPVVRMTLNPEENLF